MAEPLAFTPVPRKFRRSGGWTPERQRGFILALAEGLSPERAAQAQGLTGNGAYQLRRAAGGESFAAAWDAAVDVARPTGPRRATAAASPVRAEGDPLDDPMRKAEAIDKLIAFYGIKLGQERQARLAGRIVEADFYCRQLSWFEIVLCLGEGSLRLLDSLRTGRFGLMDIAATARSNHLEQVRRAVWREKGEPDRPPPCLVARLAGADGEIGIAHDNALRGGADWNAEQARRGTREQLQAEEQRQWEERARTDAAAWAAREAGAADG